MYEKLDGTINALNSLLLKNQLTPGSIQAPLSHRRKHNPSTILKYKKVSVKRELCLNNPFQFSSVHKFTILFQCFSLKAYILVNSPQILVKIGIFLLFLSHSGGCSHSGTTYVFS